MFLSHGLDSEKGRFFTVFMLHFAHLCASTTGNSQTISLYVTKSPWCEK